MSDIYVATSVIVIAMFLATIWIIDAIRDNANKVDNAVLHNIHDLLQRHSEEMRSMSWKQERHEDFVTYTTNENSDRLDKQIEILTDISQEIVGQGRSGLDGNVSTLRHTAESQRDDIDKILGLVNEIRYL
jgi:hypothetical protein